MIPKVTPFEVYQKYLSLKQHFNKVDYDYFKFKGKVRLNASSFENRKDKHHFVRLSKFIKKKTSLNFLSLISLSQATFGLVILQVQRAEKIIYHGSQRSKLPYVFENEVDEIL